MTNITPEVRAKAIAEARRMYADPSDDDVEVDDTAQILTSMDGVWVQAWVYVRDEQLKGEE